MTVRSWKRTGRLALAAWTSLLLLPTCAPAQDKETAELRARLEKLEKQKEAGASSPDSAADAAKQKVQRSEGYVVGSDLSFRPVWRDGLVFETPHQDFQVRFRGKVRQDWGFGDADQEIADSLGQIVDGAIFRSLRLGAAGTFYEVVNWVTEVEFASGNAQPTDVYLELAQLPCVGHFRAGHFKEPFSLEQLTGEHDTTFLERSLLDDAFVPARRLGIMLHDDPLDERMTWALGLFRTQAASNGSDFGDGEYSCTGRVTVLPWYANDGRCLLHLGVAASHATQDNHDGTLPIFRARPELRAIRLGQPALNEPYFVNTGSLAANRVDLVGLEAALVLGAFSLQAEYVCAFVRNPVTETDGVAHGDAFFYGYYVFASYFLTGEHRNYRKPVGAFTTMHPHENFFWVEAGESPTWERCCFGKGAWELTLRFSHLDLDHAGIDGGILQDITVGLNWYLNPNARFMANCILAHRDRIGTAGDGWAQLLGMRVQWDF